jgi:flagellar biosynthesis protein FlhB
MASDKTEKGTPHKRQEARKKGQVPRSRDLTSALALLAGVSMLAWQASSWVGSWHGLVERYLAIGTAREIGTGTTLMTTAAIALAQTVLPILTLGFGVAILSTVAQGGFVFAPNPIQPNWGRMNPVNNLKNLFSAGGMSRLLRSLIPGTVIMILAYSTISGSLTSIVTASRLGTRPILGLMGGLIYRLAWQSAMVLLAWAGADYALQRYQHEKSLRMTKQEVKDESKQMEGNPTVRGRIRRLRRAMRRRMLAKDVQRATAVVTNPTHYAVALEYRPETMAAPVVVAKGQNLIAQRIKEIAKWHEIPIVENPPLARALFSATEVGQVIPQQLYAAVAEILAFIYRTQARMRQNFAGAR